MANETVVVRNAKDTVLREGKPSENFSNPSVMGIRGDTTNRRWGLIHFTRPFPLGATIVSATLRLHQRGAATGGQRTVYVARVARGWQVSQVNWNRRPDVHDGAPNVTKGNGGADGRAWEFNVTNHMQLVADGADWFGWRIVSDNDTMIQFYSSDASNDFRPTLEVTWTTRPDAPSTLSPSGNRAVSIADPVLRCDFTDTSGDVTMSAIQVQINSTSNFSDPDWNSGVVLSTEPELDLSATNFPGLSNNQNVYWRVRVRDGSGQWSFWSDAAQFRRANKKTLTLLNPPSSDDLPEGVDPYVEDIAPPIFWEFNGTITAWQIILTDPDDHTDWVYNSGKRGDDSTSHTIPPGHITRADDTYYRLVLRVWDDEDREGTPGDLPWTVVRRVFKFNRDNTVDPVENLQVHSMSPEPYLKFTFNRDNAPDSFVLSRNDDVVETFRPADVHVGGTSYELVYKNIQPRRNYTWKVSARVGPPAKWSVGDPTVVGRTEPKGIWLSDVNRDINVCILGDDEGSWSSPDMAGEYEPLGSDRKVRVVQALRGLEGSLSGQLMDFNGVSAREWRRRLWELKSRPTERIILTANHIAIPVRLGNITISPTPHESQIVFNVEFEFFELGTTGYRLRR